MEEQLKSHRDAEAECFAAAGRSNLPPESKTGISHESWLESRVLELESNLAQARSAARIRTPEKYAAIRDAAKKCGFAIGVHGSQARDIDLIAVPWTDEATDQKTLAFAVAASIDGYIKNPDAPNRFDSDKPHGRVSVVIFTCGTYIDLAIFPRGGVR